MISRGGPAGGVTKAAGTNLAHFSRWSTLIRETGEATCRLRGGEITRKGGEDTMKKALMLMFALVIGLSFGAMTFAAEEKKETTKTETKTEKKDGKTTKSEKTTEKTEKTEKK